MNFENMYGKQVEIILSIIPLIYKQKEFAIKGGTGLNLFYFPIPRLSVDIDLVYLSVEDRNTSFKKINNLLNKLKNDIEKYNPNYKVKETRCCLESQVKKSRLFSTKTDL